MTITLDPGHGPKGNPYPPMPGYYEGTQMWTLSRLLAAELIKHGFEVVTTRPDLADDPELSARGKRAKGSGMFLSLHSNAAASANDTGPTGSVTYYSVKGPKHKPLADKLAEAVSGVMGHHSRGAQTRESGSTKGADYYGVIRNAAAAGCTCAMILEHGFHTNPRDAAFLAEEGNLRKLAGAGAGIIAEYFGMKKEEITDMSVYDRTIPVEDILRAEYIQGTSKTPEQMRASSGADIVLSAGIFQGTQLLLGVMKQGKVLAGDPVYLDTPGLRMGPDGFAKDAMRPLVGSRYDFLTSYVPWPDTHPNYAQKRGRMLIGLFPGYIRIYACLDGAGAMTFPEADAKLGAPWTYHGDAGSSVGVVDGSAKLGGNPVCGGIGIWLKKQGRPTLRKGDRGEAVGDMQRALNAKGASPKLNTDGIFGEKSEDALIAFQRKNGLAVCGADTWNKLEG